MNFPDIGGAKRSFILTNTASFSETDKLRLGQVPRKIAPRTLGLAQYGLAEGQCPEPSARLGLGAAEPRSAFTVGTRGLALCQAGSNPWRSDPWRRAVESAAHSEERAGSPGPSRLPALPSRPTSGAMLSQHLLDVETVLGMENSA